MSLPWLGGFPAGFITHVIDTGTYSQHPINCYMEKLPQFRYLESIIEKASGNKIPDKVILSTGGSRRLSKTAPTFTTRTKKGVLFD